MSNEHIYYINIKPYIHALPFNEIYKRFLDSKLIISNKKTDNDTTFLNEFIDFMNKQIKRYNFKVIQKDNADYEIDKILSKKIIVHLHEFFE
jgi:hypothetical protein